ncbi:hypothetical protein HBI23_024230 [Parastagonospora nodorum]|nr:hypothetical protein HBI74_174350 [Parastagonospora nodorum]KAH5429276.1 hypothetical protein HBI32_068730 [Parastagonospora nodorum]KAH5689732.1 hypothetical protein HBI23_024230 [Parastagonospora nodorum]KAH5775377.1 hypothetical protein HBI97_136730 [Parastagonospora nodorum]KAH5803307.1 hypothetical protein HBI96_130340 [Parastagonospora nodorum]
MELLTKHEFDTRARKNMPDTYDTLPRTEGLIFGMQIDVRHDRASGMKLRIGTIEDNDGTKTWIWAIVCHNSDVYFYKEHEKLTALDLKHAELIEPMRTVAGKFKDPKANRLRSYICFLFMVKGVYARFVEGRCVSFKGFEAACKRISDAKRNGFYNLESKLRLAELDEGDRGYESEAVVATLTKRGGDGNDKIGAEEHTHRHVRGNRKKRKLNTTTAEVEMDGLDKENIELKAQIQKARSENQDLHGLYQELRGDWEQLRGEYHGILGGLKVIWDFAGHHHQGV